MKKHNKVSSIIIFFLISFGLFVALNYYNQSVHIMKSSTMAKKEKLNGSVSKTITKTYGSMSDFESIITADIVDKVEIINGTTPYYQTTSITYKNNLPIEYVVVDSKGKEKSTVEKSYNNNILIYALTRWDIYNAILDQSTFYEYDHNKMLESAKTYQADGTFKHEAFYTYNILKKEYEVKVLMSNGEEQNRFKEKYNSKGQLIQKTDYFYYKSRISKKSTNVKDTKVEDYEDMPYEVSISISTYTYENDLLVKVEVQDEAGELKSTKTIKYDENNNEIESKTTLPNGDFLSNNITVYEYDEMNNWIKRTNYYNSYLGKDLFESVIHFEREIIYE